MLSKAKIKFVKSLQIKKYRKQEQSFIVEGAKSVRELLRSDFEVITLLGTVEFLSTVAVSTVAEVIEVTEQEIAGLGEFQTNNTALAVARQKVNAPVSVNEGEFVLMLDDIRDPGNLGTMIRTADWFGVTKIIASPETADLYNPKVISATMGSFTRVRVFYTSLPEYLASISVPVFGTYLTGALLSAIDFGKGGVILIGNEARGIHPDLEKYVTQKVTIAKVGAAESLNATMATGIILFKATT
jgi:TrmH family RNA methyltransferase